MHQLALWLLYITGANNMSGVWYGFWSGFGSDVGEFALLGVLWKKFNCHSSGCYRIGVHHVPGTPYVTCRKHHPAIDKSPNAKDIRFAYTKQKSDNLIKTPAPTMARKPEPPSKQEII